MRVPFVKRGPGKRTKANSVCCFARSGFIAAFLLVLVGQFRSIWTFHRGAVESSSRGPSEGDMVAPRANQGGGGSAKERNAFAVSMGSRDAAARRADGNAVASRETSAANPTAAVTVERAKSSSVEDTASRASEEGGPEANADNSTAQLKLPKRIVNSTCHQPEGYIQQYCGRQPLRCNEHTPEPSKKTADQEHCKILWFAGMHEGPGSYTREGTGYQNMYAAALNSAIINAPDSLQPVLMLGRLDMEALGDGKLSKFGTWAKEKGVVVITLPELSFQNVVDGHYKSGWPADHRQGPWLRLEIPRLIEEHNLTDVPNVCKRHALYTDSDVVFPNKIDRGDIQQLTKELSDVDAIVSYGRQNQKAPLVTNTGVFLLDIQKFRGLVPKMIKFLEEKGPFGEFDQGLINTYFRRNSLKRQLLPIHYNWKVYWKLEPSTFDQLKIVHLHGPKPGRGLEAIAICNATLVSIPAYDGLVKEGICCDKGRTASWILNFFRVLSPVFEDICE